MSSKALMESRRKILREKTEALIVTKGRPPSLSVILVGDDPASRLYVSNKTRAAESLGFISKTHEFRADTPAQKVFALVEELNQDPEVDGILIQRPLPRSFDLKEVMFWVTPEKDVDGLHPENIGLMSAGNPRFLPCTPAGIMMILDHYGLSVEGKIACVIGRSLIVGKPLATLLLSRNASVIQVHRSTHNPEELCKLADFVFASAGSMHLVNQNWIKRGAIIVDIGIHHDPTGRITGDVNQESVKSIAGGITPVPGGVGPMTIQVLMENTFLAAINQGT